MSAEREGTRPERAARADPAPRVLVVDDEPSITELVAWRWDDPQSRPQLTVRFSTPP